MPPFKENAKMDNLFPGQVIGALREAGHGKRVYIIDDSCERADDVETFRYPGTAEMALRGIANMFPVDKDFGYMVPNTGDTAGNRNPIEDKLITFAEEFGLKATPIGRDDYYHELRLKREDGVKPIVIKGISRAKFSCVRLIMDHGQFDEEIVSVTISDIPTVEQKEQGITERVNIDDFFDFAEGDPDYSASLAGQAWYRLAKLFMRKHFEAHYSKYTWYNPRDYDRVNLTYDTVPVAPSFEAEKLLSGLHVDGLQKMIDDLDRRLERGDKDAYSAVFVSDMGPVRSAFLRDFLKYRQENQA